MSEIILIEFPSLSSDILAVTSAITSSVPLTYPKVLSPDAIKMTCTHLLPVLLYQAASGDEPPNNTVPLRLHPQELLYLFKDT